MRIYERWYFGFYWNLRLVTKLQYLEGFWFLLEDFLKIILVIFIYNFLKKIGNRKIENHMLSFLFLFSVNFHEYIKKKKGYLVYWP